LGYGPYIRVLYANWSFLENRILLSVDSTFIANVSAGDRPFNNAANWGGTGLIETPNARILDDGVMRLGVANADPFRWYSGAMGVLPRIEIDGRVTEVTNLPQTSFENYGSYKDKAISIKFQVISETKNFLQLPLVLKTS